MQQPTNCTQPLDMDSLLSQYGQMMAYVVRGILSDPLEAEDCLAQVYTKIWEKRDCYDPAKAGLATWLTAICRNAAYDRLRAKQRLDSHSGQLDQDVPDPAPGPEEQALAAERRQALEQALATLSRRDYALFYRKYYYLQSTAQIAAELGLTVRGVEGRLRRIRQQLQKKLGGDRL